MDGNKNLVSFAVDSNGIIEVFVLVVWGELDVDVFTHAGGDHSFFVELNLEVGCRRRQDMKPLRLWRVIDQLDF